MTHFRGFAWAGALVALVAGGGAAEAAWDNVFQVTCRHCRQRTSASPIFAAAPVVAASPACPPPCPPQCTTRYLTRSYYQPVTTMRASYYLEPVTTTRTSYFYEPVTSYRVSCYFDPCTCSYQQVATPTTSYRLRAQTCPVTSYMQRCRMEPVTTYQQAFYYEPVTTCCQTSVGAPVFGAQPPASGGAPPVTDFGGGSRPAPGVSDFGGGSRPAPGVSDNAAPSTNDSYKYDGSRFTPYRSAPLTPYDESSYRQPQLRAPLPVTPVTSPPAPSVRLDKVASLPSRDVEGEVVLTDRRPHAGAKLLFVSADTLGREHEVTADAYGRFRVPLTGGTWLVYAQRADGGLSYQQKVEVKGGAAGLMRLTSR